MCTNNSFLTSSLYQYQPLLVRVVILFYRCWLNNIEIDGVESTGKPLGQDVPPNPLCVHSHNHYSDHRSNSITFRTNDIHIFGPCSVYALQDYTPPFCHIPWRKNQGHTELLRHPSAHANCIFRTQPDKCRENPENQGISGGGECSRASGTDETAADSRSKGEERLQGCRISETRLFITRKVSRASYSAFLK